MGFITKEDLQQARELVKQLKDAPEDQETYEVLEESKPFIMRLTWGLINDSVDPDTVSFDVLMIFSLGALGNEPEDSEWLKRIGLVNGLTRIPPVNCSECSKTDEVMESCEYRKLIHSLGGKTDEKEK